MKKLVLPVLVLIVAAIGFMSFQFREMIVTAPDIPFAPFQDTALVDPDNPARIFNVDFARVEQKFPLNRAELMKLSPANLKELSQEEVDQIYGRLTAGAIPDGIYIGDLFFRRVNRGGPKEELGTRLGEILGGGLGVLADEKLDKLEKIGRLIWKGKRFERDNRVLRNVIEDLAGMRPFIENESTIENVVVTRGGWLGKILPLTEARLLFPARLYCGQSLLDGRRESVIIDYAFSDVLPGYRTKPDALAGRGGLKIRDEIRMIRPGFYLGRAYVNRAFLLNFTLINAEIADREAAHFQEGAEIAEDCWPGEQGRTISSN